MGTALPVGLDITLDPERLNEGSAEEKAAFGLFVVRAEQRLLTEGFDTFIDASRKGPLVSGYHVAEWFAWNWWRLRWEGRSAAPDWNLAHKMNSIGEGYAWPNITIFSDGVRTALISSPSDPEAKPFRYLGALPTVVPSRDFEAAVDTFVPKILARLEGEAVHNSNLARIWADILAERGDPDVAKRRRLEAFLGRDPDSVEDDAVERLLADAKKLGEPALGELAAEAAQRGPDAVALSADGIVTIIEAKGFQGSPRDSVRLDADHKIVFAPDVPAWLFGVRAARALREQEKLGLDPINNTRLAKMAGVDPRVLTDSLALPTQGFGRFAPSWPIDNRRLLDCHVLRCELVGEDNQVLAIPAGARNQKAVEAKEICCVTNRLGAFVVEFAVTIAADAQGLDR